jgi:hypothetical protein
MPFVYAVAGVTQIHLRNIHALFSFAETLGKTLYSRAFSGKTGSKSSWILRTHVFTTVMYFTLRTR